MRARDEASRDKLDVIHVIASCHTRFPPTATKALARRGVCARASVTSVASRQRASHTQRCSCKLSAADMSLRGVRDLVTFGRRAATSWHTAVPLIPLVLLGELVLCLLIIKVIRYTPIDFKAYMEEVEGPLVHGIYNYSLLRGETGPLVYPGGFVYLYGAIRWLTHDGADVLPAQLAMAACYVATLGACIACHAIARPRGVPPWALLLVSVSLRLHSIYVLRLFNDGWAMLGFWLAVLAFLRGHWKLGSVLYSLGVSVKANVLLSAPGLLLLLLQAKGLAGALGHIALCATVQLGLGWPFLRADFFAYLRGTLGGFGDLQQKWCAAYCIVHRMCTTACACVPRAHRVHTACTPRAHCVHTACSPHAFRVHMCPACALHAHAAYGQVGQLEAATALSLLPPRLPARPPGRAPALPRYARGARVDGQAGGSALGAEGGATARAAS